MSVECRNVVAQIASVVQAPVVTRSEIDWYADLNSLYTLTGDIPWSWKR